MVGLIYTYKHTVGTSITGFETLGPGRNVSPRGEAPLQGYVDVCGARICTYIVEDQLFPRVRKRSILGYIRHGVSLTHIANPSKSSRFGPMYSPLSPTKLLDLIVMTH